MSDVIFVDTETTGLDPECHQVWEVAAIEQDGTEHHWFLSVNMADADPIALSIGGFHDRYPMGWNGPDLTRTNDLEFAVQFGRLTNGAHLCGAVPNFDEAFLRRLLRKTGFSPAWNYHLIDVEAMALGFIYGCERHRRPEAHPSTLGLALPWKSTDLSLAVGVDPPGEGERHTALGDARWVKRMYEAMTGGAR